MLANWYTLDGVAGGKPLAREKRFRERTSGRLAPATMAVPAYASGAPRASRAVLGDGGAVSMACNERGNCCPAKISSWSH